MGYYAKRMWGGASGIIQDSSLKLWLDAGNPLSYPGTGTLWSDLSGNGNNGTLVNGVAYRTANGGVMSFDGVNDYVDLGNKFNPLLQSQTVSLWFNTNNVTTLKFLLSKGNLNSGAIGFSMFIENGLLNCRINGNNTTSQRADNRFNISANAWYNISMVIDRENNTLRSYLNGVLSTDSGFGTSIAGFGSITNTNNFYIGASVGLTFFFLGQNNENILYENRALTPEEVNQNFQATRNKYGI